MADHTITLSATHERALATATAKYNSAHGTNITSTEYFQLRAAEYLDSLVNRYREIIANKMAENFDKMTPLQQADILQRLGIEL